MYVTACLECEARPLPFLSALSNGVFTTWSLTTKGHEKNKVITSFCPSFLLWFSTNVLLASTLLKDFRHYENRQNLLFSLHTQHCSLTVAHSESILFIINGCLNNAAEDYFIWSGFLESVLNNSRLVSNRWSAQTSMEHTHIYSHTCTKHWDTSMAYSLGPTLN